MISIPSGRFVVLDFETTGLSPAMGARVIEVSAREVVDGRAGHEFLTFVDPGVRVPAEITQITGITTAMLNGAPTSVAAMRLEGRHPLLPHLSARSAHRSARSAARERQHLRADW